MIRDIVRAVLVLAVLAVGCEILAVHRQRGEAAPPVWPAQPAGQTGWQPHPPAWQPVAPAWQPAAPQPAGPIRRVAREFVDLSEAVIGVIR